MTSAIPRSMLIATIGSGLAAESCFLASSRYSRSRSKGSPNIFRKISTG